MELKQMRQKSADELKAHLVELQKERFALRMQAATGQLPPSKIIEPSAARPEEVRAGEMTEQTKKLHTVEGRVVSNKMDKTVTVLVERQVKHALYGKYIRRSTKLHAHDADNSCNEGDTVRVAECAPMSKTKNWRVVEILARAAE